MTLEKLLIFGFALAARFAITTGGTTMVGDRGTERQELDNELNTLRNSGG